MPRHYLPSLSSANPHISEEKASAPILAGNEPPGDDLAESYGAEDGEAAHAALGEVEAPIEEAA